LQTYFAKTVHGGHRVRKLDSGLFEIDWPTGSVQYPSVGKALIALTNRAPDPGPTAKDPKVGFAKYFRVNTNPVTGVDTLAMFRAGKIQVATKGIDLKKRGHEVAKLFYAGFGRSVARYGYDPQDVLQEVYKGILIRNQGKCPWDASKSSFGHYVHLIIKCVLANYHRKWLRVNQAEHLGLPGRDGSEADVASIADGGMDPIAAVELDIALERLTHKAEGHAAQVQANVELTRDVALKLAQGYRRSDLAVEYAGIHRPFMVDRSVKAVRDAAADMRGGL
jgi:hypothetical protein